MSCTKCGTSNTSCGCKDTPYTTALPANCQPDANCPTPSKCSEYIDASCVYLNDGIYDADLPAKTSVEEAIQQLTLMITNPECTDTSSCNCPGGGGGGSFDGDQGIYKDTSTNPDTFTLGAPSGSQSSIPFQENRFISTDIYSLAFQGTGQYVLTAITSVFLGIGISGSAPSGIGVLGLSDDVDTWGVRGISKNGTGIAGESTNELALRASTTSLVNSLFQTNSNNVIDKLDLISIKRNYTGGSAVNGSGSSIVTSLDNVIGTRISTVLEDVGTDQIGLEIQTKDASVSPATKMALNGPGQLRLHEYGQTPANFSDTPVYILGVDASGNVIETDGLGISAINGLTENPTNTVKLGGTLIEDTTIAGDGNSRILTLDSLKSFLVNNASDIALKSNGNVSTYAENFAAYSTTNNRLLNLNQTLGQLTLDGYYASTGVLYTATPAYALGVDNTGNVLKVPFNTGGTGTITGDNGITDNTTSNVRLGGALVQNTQIAGGSGPFSLSLGEVGVAEPIDILTLYTNFLRLHTPAITTSSALANYVFTLTNPATGEGEWVNPFTVATTGSGTANYNLGTRTLNINFPTVSAYTASNGITPNSPTPNNFKLGGPLIETTTIDALSTFKLNIIGDRGTTGTEAVVEIKNNGTGNGPPGSPRQYNALRVESSGGLYTDAFAVAATGTVGAQSAARIIGGSAQYGLWVEYPNNSTSSGRAAVFIDATATTLNTSPALIAQNRTNTATAQLIKNLGAPVSPALNVPYSSIQNNLSLRCTGTALVGGGVSMRFDLNISPNTTPNQVLANSIESVWSNATDGSLTSTFRVRGRNNNAIVQLLEITGNNIFKIFGGLPEFASNAAAITGGLSVGCLYRTGENVKVVI